MKRLTEIQQLCQKRSLSKDGTARKKRLVDRLFYSRDNILALIHLYMATLPVFKSLILSLEQKTPMIHRIYDEVLNFVRKFLSSCMKPDKIASMNASQLQKLDIDNKSLLLPLNDVYIGEETAQIVSKWDYACHARHHELEMFLQGLPITNPLGTGDATKAQEFRSKVLEAYRDTTPYPKEIASGQQAATSSLRSGSQVNRVQRLQQCSAKTARVFPHRRHQLRLVRLRVSKHSGWPRPPHHGWQTAAWCLVGPDFLDGQVPRTHQADEICRQHLHCSPHWVQLQCHEQCHHPQDRQVRYQHICGISACAI